MEASVLPMIADMLFAPRTLHLTAPHHAPGNLKAQLRWLRPTTASAQLGDKDFSVSRICLGESALSIRQMESLSHSTCLAPCFSLSSQVPCCLAKARQPRRLHPCWSRRQRRASTSLTVLRCTPCRSGQRPRGSQRRSQGSGSPASEGRPSCKCHMPLLPHVHVRCTVGAELRHGASLCPQQWMCPAGRSSLLPQR